MSEESEEHLEETLQLQDSEEVTDPSETIEFEDVKGVFQHLHQEEN
jgi:hypothetical protein